MPYRTLALLVFCPVILANDAPTTAIEFDRDNIVTHILIDGRPTRVKVAPDGTATPVVNSSVAHALEKKGSMVKGAHFVGATKVIANSNMAKIDFGDGNVQERRIFWFAPDWTKSAEGVIGPLALPQESVTYRLGATHAAERTIILPLFMDARKALHSKITVGDEEIPITFTFDRSETMLTAATGALLAAHHGGKMVGEPRNVDLQLGFARPVRTMEFARPVMAGGLQLLKFVVRTQDTGSTIAIPDETSDPDEIVVSAKGRGKPLQRINVGTASLIGCSTLTFDKVRKEIRLSCLR